MARPRIYENAKARVRAWRKKNRQKYNKYMREYRTKKESQSQKVME